MLRYCGAGFHVVARNSVTLVRADGADVDPAELLDPAIDFPGPHEDTFSG